MNKLHLVLTAIVIVAVIGMAISFSWHAQSPSQLLNPTPTFDLSQPFQIISPSPDDQQQMQAATQQRIPSPTLTYGVEEPLPGTVSAVIQTNRGSISLNLFTNKAPKTVRNFISKSNSGFYNGLTFHRIEDWVVQGGDPKGDGTGGGQMPAEQTTDAFVIGSVGVARAANPAINNDSQFFITKKEAAWLNGQYTNFGIVTSGMDVVDKLQIGDKITSISVNLTQTE